MNLSQTHDVHPTYGTVQMTALNIHVTNRKYNKDRYQDSQETRNRKINTSISLAYSPSPLCPSR